MLNFEITTIGELVAIRDALQEHVIRTELDESRGDDPELYDSSVVEGVLDRIELEISRQGY